MVSFWGRPLATTLTLKNIPDEVYLRLKASARLHRRSLNSEAIVCLEAALHSTRVGVDERLGRVRALRGALPSGQFNPQDIETMRQEGRP
jgi:plasmid stability protein